MATTSRDLRRTSSEDLHKASWCCSHDDRIGNIVVGVIFGIVVAVVVIVSVMALYFNGV